MKTLRVLAWIAVGVAVAWALFFWLRPAPVSVETAEVRRGPLVVTVDEEGETRVRDRFVVAAPTPGRVLRIDLDPGDVVAVDAVVAHLQPVPLDRRERAGARAHVDAAEANLRAADAAVARAEAALAQAVRDARRMEKLHAAGTTAEEQLERARLEETTRAREAEGARYAARAAIYELEVARSALLAAGEFDAGQKPVADSVCGGEACIPVRSPVAGRVLRIHEESERVVASGTPLLEVGDPSQLEVVVDVLSADAVRIHPGARMLLARWGGGSPLAGSVRRVEPSGFTKVSTLGVEEQRVNVIGDLDAPPEGLGDGFRVEAQIVVFEADDVVQVPPAALFRHQDGFAVFVVDGGVARRRPVDVGERGSAGAELRSGVVPGERVILYPSDRITDGVRVREASS